jgi:hypothetical protein
MEASGFVDDLGERYFGETRPRTGCEAPAQGSPTQCARHKGGDFGAVARLCNEGPGATLMCAILASTKNANGHAAAVASERLEKGCDAAERTRQRLERP